MPTPEEIKQEKDQQEKDAILPESKDFAVSESIQEEQGIFSDKLPDNSYEQGIFRIDFINRLIKNLPTGNIATSTRKFLKLRPEFLLSGVLEADVTVVSVAGTAGETTLNSYTIPLNTISRNQSGTATSGTFFKKAGNVFRVRAAGRYTTDDATATVAIACKVGSTTYHTITTTGATVSNAPWNIDWLIIVATIGSSGTVESQCIAKTNNVNKDSANTATIAIDTTANQIISLTATWTSGSAGDNLSIRQFLIELLN